MSLVPYINAYLLPAPDVFVESRREALSADRPLVFGSMPNDGGFLSDWSPERRAEVLAKWPGAAPLFRRLTGSQEYINGIKRWCLWLKDASDLIFLVPHATLYHFGVLTSNVHMAWMRAVAGRLEMRYRYSTQIVYNNFPWPEIAGALHPAVCPLRVPPGLVRGASPRANRPAMGARWIAGARTARPQMRRMRARPPALRHRPPPNSVSKTGPQRPAAQRLFASFRHRKTPVSGRCRAELGGRRFPPEISAGKAG